MSVHLLNSGLRPALRQIMASGVVSVHQNRFSSRSAHINHLQQQSMQSESVGIFNLSPVSYRPDQRFDIIVRMGRKNRRMNSMDVQSKVQCLIKILRIRLGYLANNGPVVAMRVIKELRKEKTTPCRERENIFN